MVALTTLVQKLCVVSGLILMFWIYPSSAKHTGEPFNLVTDAQGLAVENTRDKTIAVNESTSQPVGIHNKEFVHPTNFQSRGSHRGRMSVITPKINLDKILSFITAANKLMNSHTENNRLDRLTRSFNSFFTSDAFRSLAVFYNMWASVWTIIDAVANIFRVNEGRLIDAIEDSTEGPDPLEDVEASLDEANTNLVDVSDLINALDCDSGSGCTRRNVHDIDPLITQAMQHASLQAVRQDVQTKARYESTIGEQNDNPIDVKNYGYNLHPLINRFRQPSQTSSSNQSLKSADSSAFSNSTNLPLIHRQTSVETNRHFYFPVSYDSNLSLGRSRSKRAIIPPDFGVTRFVTFMNRANDVLNSRSNNKKLDRFMSAFNDLFDSDGLNAFNGFYTVIASFWTVVDAAANVFRFNEARIKDGKEQKKAQSEPDPLEELQDLLDDTNSNLVEFSDLIKNLACNFEADIEDIPAGCFAQDNAANARADEANKKTRHFSPVGYTVNNDRENVVETEKPLIKNKPVKNRRNRVKFSKNSPYSTVHTIHTHPVSHQTRNVVERSRTETKRPLIKYNQVNHNGNHVKFSQNGSHSTAHTIRHSSSFVQQTRNAVDSGRIETVRQIIYPIKQSSHLPMKTQPSVQTNRLFYYPVNKEETLVNNTQLIFPSSSSNRNHPIYLPTGRGSNSANSHQIETNRHISPNPLKISQSDIADNTKLSIQRNRHNNSATQGNRRMYSQPSIGNNRHFYSPVIYGNNNQNQHPNHPSTITQTNRLHLTSNQQDTPIESRRINPQLSSDETNRHIYRASRRNVSNRPDLHSIANQWYRKSNFDFHIYKT